MREIAIKFVKDQKRAREWTDKQVYVSGSGQLVADPVNCLFKDVKEGTYNEETNPKGMTVSSQMAKIVIGNGPCSLRW